MSTLTATAPPRLTAADRCDRCSAAALVQVDLASGGSLLFCGHHYSANEKVLASRQIVARVHDQRDSIA